MFAFRRPPLHLDFVAWIGSVHAHSPDNLAEENEEGEEGEEIAFQKRETSRLAAGVWGHEYIAKHVFSCVVHPCVLMFHGKDPAIGSCHPAPSLPRFVAKFLVGCLLTGRP